MAPTVSYLETFCIFYFNLIMSNILIILPVMLGYLINYIYLISLYLKF